MNKNKQKRVSWTLLWKSIKIKTKTKNYEACIDLISSSPRETTMHLPGWWQLLQPYSSNHRGKQIKWAAKAKVFLKRQKTKYWKFDQQVGVVLLQCNLFCKYTAESRQTDSSNLCINSSTTRPVLSLLTLYYSNTLTHTPSGSRSTSGGIGAPAHRQKVQHHDGRWIWWMNELTLLLQWNIVCGVPTHANGVDHINYAFDLPPSTGRLAAADMDLRPAAKQRVSQVNQLFARTHRERRRLVGLSRKKYMSVRSAFQSQNPTYALSCH